MQEGPCVAAGPFSPLVYGYARGCSSTGPGRRSAYATQLLAQMRPFSCNIDYSRREKAAARNERLSNGGLPASIAAPFRKSAKSQTNEVAEREGFEPSIRF